MSSSFNRSPCDGPPKVPKSSVLRVASAKFARARACNEAKLGDRSQGSERWALTRPSKGIRPTVSASLFYDNLYYPAVSH